jgi:Zn-finger nucleic acid-binding protein
MTDRSGIEIDFCPSCRGVWLDRGELDKIIERAAAAPAPSGNAGYQQPMAPSDYRSGSYSHGHYGHHRPRKKKSFLSEVFDFD